MVIVETSIFTRQVRALLMLLIYSKSERDDLTPDQLKTLKKIVKEEYS